MEAQCPHPEDGEGGEEADHQVAAVDGAKSVVHRLAPKVMQQHHEAVRRHAAEEGIAKAELPEQVLHTAAE